MMEEFVSETGHRGVRLMKEASFKDALFGTFSEPIRCAVNAPHTAEQCPEAAKYVITRSNNISRVCEKCLGYWVMVFARSGSLHVERMV